MTFLIADTFTGSLARLTADEQKATKTTAFDVQMDAPVPASDFLDVLRGTLSDGG